MQCPACHIPLQIIRSQDLVLHYCPRCGALYEVLAESIGSVPRRGGTRPAAPLALGLPPHLVTHMLGLGSVLATAMTPPVLPAAAT